MRWSSKPKIGRPGNVIAGRYRLEKQLAGGAMGTIWSAEHVRLRSRVAIKFLDPSIADDPEMLERFLREAQSAAAVRSTHVVQIFDCGVSQGDPYIAMELLQGMSLDARLARGRLAPAELNKIFSEVAIAVGNAHALGVIHRDLKPANIFLARERELEVTKVLDFGIAKVMNDTLSLATGVGTRTGTLLGTPNYMSPEQARGSRSVDQSTDLWSLAIIAFECLTGQRPFGGETLGEVMVQICTELPLVPSSVADVPAGFDQWFLKGASKEPAQRFSSAHEMAEALGEILRAAGAPLTESVGYSPPTASEEPGTLPSRSALPLPVPPGALSGPSAMSRTLVLFEAAEGALRRGAASLRRFAPFAMPLALAGVVAVLALWYGVANHTLEGTSRPSSSATIVAAAARLEPEPLTEPPQPMEVRPGELEHASPAAAPTSAAAPEGGPVEAAPLPVAPPEPPRGDGRRRPDVPPPAHAGRARTERRNARARPAPTVVPATSGSPATGKAGSAPASARKAADPFADRL